jgi:hypothetical protein
MIMALKWALQVAPASAASGGLLALALATLVLAALQQLAAERQHWRGLRFAGRLALLAALLDLASNVPQLRELAERDGGSPHWQAPREAAATGWVPGWVLTVVAPASGPLPEQNISGQAACTVLLDWAGAERSLELAVLVLRPGSEAHPGADPRDAHELALAPGWNDIRISDRTVLAGLARAGLPAPLNVSLLLAHKPRPACVRLDCDAAWSVQPPARCSDRRLEATGELDAGLFWLGQRPRSRPRALLFTNAPDAGKKRGALWTTGLATAAVVLLVGRAILRGSPRDRSTVPAPALVPAPAASATAPEHVPRLSDGASPQEPHAPAAGRGPVAAAPQRATTARLPSPASSVPPAGTRLVALAIGRDDNVPIPTEEMLDEPDSPLWDDLFRQVEGPAQAHTYSRRSLGAPQ